MKRLLKQTLCILVLFLLCTVFCLTPFALGAPAEVTDMYNGVLRIICFDNENPEYVFMGTGFAVGKGERIYVVTNNHVVEDCEEFFLFYDTGKYVTASIVSVDTARDLCILKPNSRIPRVTVFNLETEEFGNGGAAWALGFPGVGDDFLQNYGSYNSDEEYLASVVADKNSMTITSGDISAIRDSNIFGDGSRVIRAIQTNADINGGNSGGPLLNQYGRVIGVNTLGFDESQGMNGAIHVQEVMDYLDENNIVYAGKPSEEGTEPARQQGIQTSSTSALLIVIIVCATVIIIVAVAFIVKRSRKNP